jgi:tetratricopeptide (TPR) repeat protein
MPSALLVFPGMRARLLASALLAALAFGVFFQVREHDFVDYDDLVYIVENPNLESGLSLDAVLRAFSRPYHANWIPLTALSFQIDYALYGENPTGYHLTNLVLHAASSILLFLALARMTAAPGRSLFVAAVFAVHPLHVESVAWAAERKDTLSGLFWMLAMFFHAGHAGRPVSRARQAAVSVCGVLGLLAKPMLVTLPFALLLLDYWPLGRLRGGSGAWPDPARLRRRVGEKLPLFVAAAAVGVVTVVVQRSGGAMVWDPPPFGARLANALESYVVYAVDAFWPSGLAVFYPHPGLEVGALSAAAAGALLAAVTAAVLRVAASHPYLVVGWLWYLGTLLPVIGLLQVGMQARADRYTYIPLIGLSIAVAWGAAHLAGRARALRVALAVLGSAAIVLLALVAWRQVGTWRDTVALFEHAIAVTDGNYAAHHRLGATLRKLGRLDEAVAHYEEALRMHPAWPDAQFELASLLEGRGERERAILHYQRGLVFDPDHALARGNLGALLVGAGRYEAALPHLERALAGRPESVRIHNALGVASQRLGRPDEAIRHHREALRLDPDDLSAANNLAWVLATTSREELRDPGEALRIVEAAVARAPEEHPVLLDTLAAAQAAAGRFDDAIRSAARGARLAAARGDADGSAAARRRLAVYRTGRPWVEGARADPPGAGDDVSPPPREGLLPLGYTE